MCQTDGRTDRGNCNIPDAFLKKRRDKNNITKSMSLLFFRAVYHSQNHVIPHSVIAAILDVILPISKCRKQQYASQILQIQPLLNIMGK